MSPTVVLQSSWRSRLHNDKWQLTLQQMQVKRLITSQSGTIELTIDRNYLIAWSTFLQGEELSAKEYELKRNSGY